MFSLTVRRLHGRTVITIAGEVDIESAPTLAEALVLREGPLEIDCAELHFIDVAGLRVLYEAASRERVILRRPSALTVRILEVLGWDQAFRVIHEPPPKPPARPPVRFTTKGY